MITPKVGYQIFLVPLAYPNWVPLGLQAYVGKGVLKFFRAPGKVESKFPISGGLRLGQEKFGLGLRV